MDKKIDVSNVVTSRSILPFSGGLLFVAYAFFWPVQYGTWLGTIVKAFRSAAGI